MVYKGKIKCNVCGDVHQNPVVRQLHCDGLPRIVVTCPRFNKEFQFERRLIKK